MAINKTVRSAQDSKFENIVVGKFSANEDFDHHVSGVVLASQRTKGTFSVNHFAIAQFLASAATVSAETSGKLMAKLGLLLFQDEKNMEITLTRAEVIELRDVLQVRMAHCEHERDARSDKFNPDTYIGQKFLLLDIREWLMITAIGEFKQPEPVEEEPARVYNPADEKKEPEIEWDGKLKDVQFRWVPNGRTWEKLHIIKNVHKDFSEPGYYLTYEAAKAVYDNLDSSQFFIGTRTNQTCADWEINDLN